jgi:hypothetical protein
MSFLYNLCSAGPQSYSIDLKQVSFSMICEAFGVSQVDQEEGLLVWHLLYFKLF